MAGLERHLWMLYAFLTLFFWGYFSPQLTLASRAFGLKFLLVNGGAMFVIGILATVFQKSPATYNSSDFKNLFLGGIASAMGYLFFTLALDNAKKYDGSINAVVVICGMWIALAVIRNWHALGEAMTPVKWLGVAFAIAAVVCISWGGGK